MGNYDEEKNNINPQPVEDVKAEAGPSAEQPANEYWVRSDSTPNKQPAQTQTTPHGYGQGYSQPYQREQGYIPPNPYSQDYHQGAYPPPQNPQQYRGYQYNPNSGWQPPPPQYVQPPRVQEQYQWNFEDYDKASGSKAKPKKSRGLAVFVVALACVLGLGLISVSAWGIYSYVNGGDLIIELPGAKETESASSVASAQLEISSKPQISESMPVSGKMTIPQVAKAVSPSVVGVIQYQQQNFGQTGAGSGIIMSTDGYVITNAHVVADGDVFKVVLADGTPKDADLIGFDTLTDLAVLKINGADGLTPAVFGDSTQVEVGESVIAIGNPAGTELAGSVTLGIVSAVNRQIPSAHTSLIQTDAAINPGNSGGPLVNEYGQVIGINSTKIVHEYFEGIGFAIPISEAKPILDDIVTNGRVTGRVKLGVKVETIDEIDARNYNVMQGVRIDEIFADSDLMNYDVQRYDIITHIDGERVLNGDGLKSELAKHKPGDKVTLTLFRLISATRSNTFDVTVQLQEDK